MQEDMKEKVRLDRFLVSQNVGSRKEAARLIRKKLVTVDGETVDMPDEKVFPGACVIAVAGNVVQYHKYLYIMMNKPAGVLSASRDNRGETVLDLLPPGLRRRGLFPAGRLDKDTTGLLVITDDGDYAHRMLSPKKHVYKTYLVESEREITAEDVRVFYEGISYGEEFYAPAKLEKFTGREGDFSIISIREGKFHQVKRMFQAVGNPVLKLKRLQIGNLFLDEKLKPGECRVMEIEEAFAVFTGKLD